MAELGGLIVHLCVDACIGLYEAGKWPRNLGSPSEPIICALKGTVPEGFTVPETVITK